MASTRRLDDWGFFIPSPDMVMDYLTRQWREEQEQKPLNLNSQLSAALNKCPAPWINGICKRLGLSTRGKQKDKVRQIVAQLTDAAQLERIVRALPRDSQEALAFVVAEGGWVKIGQLTRQFGASGEDGWFWEERPPTSLLGQLRGRGLLFIGKAGIDGRNYTVAVVPKELREPLAVILTGASASEEPRNPGDFQR